MIEKCSPIGPYLPVGRVEWECRLHEVELDPATTDGGEMRCPISGESVTRQKPQRKRSKGTRHLFYIKVKKGEVAGTEEVAPDIFIDRDEDGKVVGIEVLHGKHVTIDGVRVRVNEGQ